MINWLTKFELKVCVSVNCPVSWGWILCELKIGLIGSV